MLRQMFCPPTFPKMCYSLTNNIRVEILCHKFSFLMARTFGTKRGKPCDRIGKTFPLSPTLDVGAMIHKISYIFFLFDEINEIS